MDWLQGRLKRNENIVMRTIAGETVLIPIHQTGVDLQNVFMLNETATEVWKLLENPISKAELAAALLEQFDINVEVLEKDLDELLIDFRREDFIVI